MIGYIRHVIKSRSDVSKMQNKLKSESSEKSYIAMELAENMIDAGECGEILINGTCIKNVINTKSKIADVREAIGKAKFYKDNKLTGRIGESKQGSNLGGKGLLSILHSGWNLEIEESNSTFAITATKYRTSLQI